MNHGGLRYEMTKLDLEKPLDLVWGIENIAAYIGRSRSQTYLALTKNEIPAKLVNRRWAASRSNLRKHFEVIQD
tara:strand:+ start:8214 stop:8435 length:222 start_codon:yes stop_codon:yes gene_type:complete